MYPPFYCGAFGDRSFILTNTNQASLTTWVLGWTRSSRDSKKRPEIPQLSTSRDRRMGVDVRNRTTGFWLVCHPGTEAQCGWTFIGSRRKPERFLWLNRLNLEFWGDVFGMCWGYWKILLHSLLPNYARTKDFDILITTNHRNFEQVIPVKYVMYNTIYIIYVYIYSFIILD